MRGDFPLLRGYRSTLGWEVAYSFRISKEINPAFLRLGLITIYRDVGVGDFGGVRVGARRLFRCRWSRDVTYYFLVTIKIGSFTAVVTKPGFNSEIKGQKT